MLLALTFDLSLTGHAAGDGFAIDLAVADVPEPRSAVLLATGLALVFGLARRRAPLAAERSLAARVRFYMATCGDDFLAKGTQSKAPMVKTAIMIQASLIA